MKRREFVRLIATGAVVGAASTAWTLETESTGPFVRGWVVSDGKPLANAIVSNGRQLTRTDAAGHYSLPTGPDAGRFLFVCCPRGHWTNDFYRSIDEAVRTGKADFALQSVSQSDRFDFVFAADLSNLGNASQEIGRKKTKASIAEICNLSPKPAFLWIQGDLGLRGDDGKRFLDCLKTATIPIRVGIGNHEIMPSEPNPKAVYERLFGPTYYSFDWGPVHFVVLDGNKPAAHIRGNSLGTVEPRELAWLEADLAAQPAGKPIIVGVHIPIVSTYADRRSDLKETEGPFWQSANRSKVTTLLARYGVRLVLQGHVHENERTTQDGVEYVESVSLCGRWWKSGAGFERATDDSPRGYRIVSVDGHQIRHRYQSSCESRVDRQGEFMKLPKTVRRNNKTSFVFNCYDAPNGSKASARLDDGPWHEMRSVILHDSGMKKPHHWRWTTDTTSLAAGRHAIEARVIWPDGTTVREASSFRVGEPPRDGQSREKP
ncbi:MAG: calcineurin-like phosphoesterase C-terminal domain-containing protein [Pirellulales bacterium]|nr:calcineurin-like phosphoesterase C-terminal domain-containing protein [Pirellulales bacterium]